MTDEAINRACAELCGWEWWKCPNSGIGIDRQGQLLRPGTQWASWVRCQPAPEETHQTYVPEFCYDRNALPELLAAIERAGKQEERDFNLHFCAKSGIDEFDRAGAVAWDILKADSRLVVECALRACGRWKE